MRTSHRKIRHPTTQIQWI